MRDRPVRAVVLHWRNPADTERAVASLLEDGGADGVIVVDNGSRGEHALPVSAAWSGDARVEVLSLPRNAGFAGGVNAGAGRAFAEGAAAVLLLNNDAVVERGLVAGLEAALRGAPGAGASGPRILRDDGGGLPWFRGGRIGRTLGQVSDDDTPSSGAGTAPRATGFLTFCCVLIAREAWERVGPLDAEFFAYYEDADWCVRAERAGVVLVHSPGVVARHRVGGSAGAGTPLHAYLLARGRVLFVRRHARRWRRRLVFWPWMLLVRWPHDALLYLGRRSPASAVAAFRGLMDGRRGGPPRRFLAELGLEGTAS